MADAEETVLIRLTADEAIVLLDLLARWGDENERGETPNSACFESTAEGAALNALEAVLQKQVASVFDPDWNDIVAAARRRIAPQWDYATLRG